MWDAMCDLFGEDVVKRRVEELARARDEADSPRRENRLGASYG